MILHTFNGSPNGRKVEAVIHHLGLDVQIVHHDFPAGLSTSEFRAINPNGKVPVLVDGSFTLWESNAIMQYLADQAEHGGDLLPRDGRSRADVARWQFWEQRHFNKAFGALAWELVAKPHLRLEADPVQIDAALKELARFAPVLESALQRRHYLVGERLTVADYSTITFESYRTLTPFDWSGFPNINAYFDRVRASESWAQVARKIAA